MCAWKKILESLIVSIDEFWKTPFLNDIFKESCF
jgi:hypothetical protein